MSPILRSFVFAAGAALICFGQPALAQSNGDQKPQEQAQKPSGPPSDAAKEEKNKEEKKE